MIRATVLIRTEIPSGGGSSSQAKKILNELRSYPGIIDAFVMYGRFDMVVQIELDSFKEIVSTATRIKSVPQVHSTETLIEVDQTLIHEAYPFSFSIFFNFSPKETPSDR